MEKHHIDRIIFAIPTASVQERKEILNICKECGCKLQTIPGIYQLVNEEVSVSKLRDVEITDLLGREQLQVNNDEILKMISQKRCWSQEGAAPSAASCAARSPQPIPAVW